MAVKSLVWVGNPEDRFSHNTVLICSDTSYIVLSNGLIALMLQIYHAKDISFQFREAFCEKIFSKSHIICKTA